MKKIIIALLYFYFGILFYSFSQNNPNACVKIQDTLLLCKEKEYKIPLQSIANPAIYCSYIFSSNNGLNSNFYINLSDGVTTNKLNITNITQDEITISIPNNISNGFYNAKIYCFVFSGTKPGNAVRGEVSLSNSFTISVYDNLSTYVNGANFSINSMNANYTNFGVCRNNAFINISPIYNFTDSEYIVRMPLGTICGNNSQLYTTSTDQNYIYFHFSTYLANFRFNLTSCAVGSHSLELKVKNTCGEVSSNQMINLYDPLNATNTQITGHDNVCLNKKNLYKFQINTTLPLYADEYYWYFAPKISANCNYLIAGNGFVYTTNQPFLETNLEELAQQMMASSIFAGGYRLMVYAKGKSGVCDNNLVNVNLGNGKFGYFIGEKLGLAIIPPRVELSLDKNVTCTTEKNGSLLLSLIPNTYNNSLLNIDCFVYELYNTNDDRTPIKTGNYNSLQGDQINFQINNLLTDLPAGDYYIKVGFRNDGTSRAGCDRYYYGSYCPSFYSLLSGNNNFFCDGTQPNGLSSCCFYQSNTIKIIDGSPFFNVLCTSSTGCGTNQRGVIKVKTNFPGYNGSLPNGTTFAGFVYRLRNAQSGEIINEGHVPQLSNTGERDFDIVSNLINAQTTYNLEVSAALSSPNTNNQAGCYSCFTPYCKSNFDIYFKSTKFEVSFLQSAWQDNTDTYFKCTNSGDFQIPVSLFAQTSNNCGSDLLSGYRIRVVGTNAESQGNYVVFDRTYTNTSFMIANSLSIPIALPGRYTLQFSGTGTYSNCIIEKPFVILQPEVTIRTAYKDITCVGNLGEASIYANGGIGNLGYKWEKISGVAPLGFLPFTGSSLTGLTVGTYRYYITMPELSNYLLCDYIAAGTITIANTLPLVTAVVFSGSGGSSCLAGATINLSASQFTNYIGQFYSIEWSKSDSNNGTFSPLFSQMVQQNNVPNFSHSLPNELFTSNLWYKIKVTDPNGCVLESSATKLTKPTQTRTYEICIRWESYDLTPDEITTPINLAINPVEIKKDLQNQIESCLNNKLSALTLDLEKCNDATLIQDALTIEYKQTTGHYMLYYYDRAGRLTKTVPPAGVRPLNDSLTEVQMREKIPSHTMATTYEYNSLGQVVSQNSPDGGRTYFVHDKLGRIRFSEDAQQRLDNAYSYKKYDELGRVYEVGKQQKGATSVSNFTGSYTTEIGEQFNQFINLDALTGCINAPLPRTYQINQIPNWLSAKLDDSNPNITTNTNNTLLLLPDRGDATTFSFTSPRNGNAAFVLQLANNAPISVVMVNKTDNQTVFTSNFGNSISNWSVNLIQNKAYTVKVTALNNNVEVDFLKATIYPAVIINNNTNEPNRVSLIDYNNAAIVWAAITPPQNTTVASYSVELKRGFVGNITVSSAIVNINPNNIYSYSFANLLQNTFYRAEIRANYNNNTQSPITTLYFTTSNSTSINLEAENNTQNNENSTLRLSGYPSCGEIGTHTFNISINGGACNIPISIAVNNTSTDPVFVGTIEERQKNDKIGRTFPCVGGSSEETITVYTTPANNLTYQGKPQTNLLNRVSYAYTNNKYDAGDGNRVHNYYSYDTHGHVEWLAIDIPGLPRKFVAYDYDLLSGKVHKVKYNEGQSDQFFHRYEYDADNRLLEVYTSTNNVTWDKDAKYKYYAHGPLQRVELGQNKIQGLDYVYTIQGWLKGINSPQAHIAPKPYLDQEPNATNYTDNITPQYEGEDYERILDVGKDGFANTVVENNNAQSIITPYSYIPTPQDFRGSIAKGTKFEVYNPEFAPDQFGMALSYFNGDYISQDEFGQQSVFNSNEVNGLAMQPLRQLYNGNISAWTTQTNRREATTNQYTYDRLHRIKTSTFYKSISFANIGKEGYFEHQATNYHQTSYSYDANGNIQNLQRSDNLGNAMDNFTYNYSAVTAGSLNKLNNVTDNVLGNDDYKKDLKGEKNYTYDAIGNIISQQNTQTNGTYDNSTIEWNAYGKVAKVTRNRSDNVPNKNTQIVYLYDPMGNRVTKRILNIDNEQTDKTFYTRDAQGNVLSIYENGKQKKYRDDRDNIYYFNAQNELINYTDKTGKNLFTFNIKGKLIFEKGQAFVCIVKIEQEYGNCNDRIQLTDITDENLITQTEVPIYGSDRIGTYNPPAETQINSDIYILNRSYKRYELKDHLGNVRVTVSDSKRVSFVSETLVFSADIKTYTDYYAFGMEMVGRNWSESEAYRQGYNGKENDKDFGEGVQDYGARLSDNQVARWFSLDPLMGKNAEKTPYNYIGNNPILYVDPDGKDNIVYILDFRKPEKGMPTSSDIAKEMNKRFEDLGLETRAVVVSSQDAHKFNYKYMDNNDAMCIIGKTGIEVVEQVKKLAPESISSGFGGVAYGKNGIRVEDKDGTTRIESYHTDGLGSCEFTRQGTGFMYNEDNPERTICRSEEGKMVRVIGIVTDRCIFNSSCMFGEAEKTKDRQILTKIIGLVGLHGVGHCTDRYSGNAHSNTPKSTKGEEMDSAIMTDGSSFAAHGGIEAAYKKEIEAIRGIFAFGSNYVDAVRQTFGASKGTDNYNCNKNEKKKK